MTPLKSKSCVVGTIVSMALLNTLATLLTVVAGTAVPNLRARPVSDLVTHEQHQQHLMMNYNQLLPVDTVSGTHGSGTRSGTGDGNSVLQQLDTGLQMKAGDVFEYPHCIDTYHLYSPVSQPTATFRVSEGGGFAECFEYCQLTVKCDVFSYDHLGNKCSLHRNTTMEERIQSPSIVGRKEETVNPFEVIASKNCLQCLESVERVFTASYGVKLEQAFMVYGQAGNARCLSVSSNRTNYGSNGADSDTQTEDSYMLEWKPCSKANTWVITQVQENKTRPGEMGYDAVRVSLYENPRWSLEFRPFFPDDEESFFVVYLARTDLDKAGQILYMRKSRGETCEYEFATISKSSDWYWSVYTLIRDDGYNHFDKNLNEIRVVDAGPQHKKCPIESVSVKNGRVTNEEKVPFFLEGSAVKIRCNKGYKLNSTGHARQILSCSRRAAGKLITPCVAEEEILGERFKRESIYMSIIILLFALLVLCTINQPWSKVCSVFKSKQLIDPHQDRNKSDQNNEIHVNNMITSRSYVSNSRSKSPASDVDNAARLHANNVHSNTDNEPNCSTRRIERKQNLILKRASTILEVGQLAEETKVEAEAGSIAKKESEISITDQQENCTTDTTARPIKSRNEGFPYSTSSSKRNP